MNFPLLPARTDVSSVDGSRERRPAAWGECEGTCVLLRCKSPSRRARRACEYTAIDDPAGQVECGHGPARHPARPLAASCRRRTSRPRSRCSGAMLLSPGAIGAVTEILSAGDFYRESHGTIFRACLALYQQGEPVDAITLVDALEERGELEAVGGQREDPRARGARPGDRERGALRADRARDGDAARARPGRQRDRPARPGAPRRDDRPRRPRRADRLRPRAAARHERLRATSRGC